MFLSPSHTYHVYGDLYTLYTCIPSFPPPCSQGLDNSIGRASHRRCESVGSIPTQVLRFFSKKKILGLVYRCYSNVLGLYTFEHISLTLNSKHFWNLPLYSLCHFHLNHTKYKLKAFVYSGPISI